MARHSPYPQKARRAADRATKRQPLRGLQRAINNRFRRAQGPTVGIELICERQIFGGKTMGEAVHPYFSVPRLGLEPNTGFRQPGAWADFIGRSPDATAAML